MTENMDESLYKNITLDYKHIIIDEIALEGLEGIGIDLLWRRVEKRISAPVTEKMKIRYWSFIVNSKNISFYTLPEPVPHIEIMDRFQIVDGLFDILKDPDTYLDGPYEYQPIENEYGSCVNYHTRIPLSNSELCSLSYVEVVSKYGPYLVLVASLIYRWQAIASHQCISYLQQLTPVHYCILELIGRSRENGQMTLGNTNLLKIVKDSKLLFYNRKVLQEMDLIRTSYVTQKIGERGVKSILLRLKRFYQRDVLTMPKVGKLCSLINYLKDKPEYSERTEIIIKKGFLTRSQNKKLQKASKVFEFGDKVEHIEANSGPNKKQKVPLKRRHIYLSTKSDESSQSEEETEPPLKCQYKVGINLLRQAYERFLDAGLKGLTQLELGKLIGAEFYTTRSICRFLKSKNIVREILEDVGRQRTARYIAVAAGKTVNNYEVEKKKFLEYCNQGIKIETGAPETPSSSFVENNEASVVDTIHKVCTDDGDVDVIEVKTIESLGNTDKTSLFNSKKSLTLRQLRYANGILKILNDKQIVCGYQPLSNLVANEIGEAPMDTKALKLFIQKLIMDGQMKMYKLKSPGSEPKYTAIMCPAHITPTSLVLRAKCKDIAARARLMKDGYNKKRTSVVVDPKLLTRYAYPRYIKVRKLHEFIVKLAYFIDSKNENIRNVHRGCLYLADIIPDMSVGLALGNVSDFGSLNVEDSNELQAAIKMKVRDAPQHVTSPIITSNSFRNALRGNLKLLALFGLIQVIDQPLTLAFSGIAFHVNLHAKIVDTTGKWPRPDANINSLERRFYFKNMSDVFEFWDIVYQISSNTNITVEKRMKCKLKPTVRQKDEVLSLDIGYVPGDGNGPCGFDSGLYLDLPRLWRSLNVKLTKTLPKPVVKSVKIPKLKIKRRLKAIKIEKKKPKYQPPKVVEELRVPKARGSRISDTMGKWTKTEDLVISLCKTAITIISPSSQPGCLSLRNITARDILTQIDPKKTQKKCHKRALMLESDSNRAYEKDCLLNEFRRRRNLVQKYTGLLKQLRIRYSTNITKCVNEARLPMLELIWILYKITQSKSYMKNTPCIAMNVENFRNNFIIRPTSVHRPYNAYKGQDDSDSRATLKEIIILTVAMSHNQVLPLNIAQKIYTVFKSYPEIVLRKAIDELRKSQAITEKNWTSRAAKMNLQDLVECSYKFSAGYYRKLIAKLNASFFDDVSEVLEQEFPMDDVKGSPSLNCVASELQACGHLEIVTSVIPSFAGVSIAQDSIQEDYLNVIDIESKYRLKSGSLGVKNKTKINKPAELFRRNNMANLLTALSRQAQAIYPDNESIDSEDVIVRHLDMQREKGSTYQEIQKYTKLDTNALCKRLTDLESKHIIKRVGHYDNRVVLIKYIKPWTMTVDDKTFIPSPWLTINMTIHLDIFFKWVDATMSKIFESPGCSIAYLTDNFELITAKSIQDICIFLQNCKCITMKVMQHQTVDLFSDDLEPELLDYNEYESPGNIYIFLEKNSITTYAYIRKQLMDACLFKQEDTMSD